MVFNLLTNYLNSANGLISYLAKYSMESDNAASGKSMASTIQNQLKENWGKLHPNIQERFAKEPELGEEFIGSAPIIFLRESLLLSLLSKRRVRMVK